MRFASKPAHRLVALFLSAPMLSWAGPVLEAELDGTAINNTLGTAQVIAPGSFTPNANPNVFGILPTATVSGRGGNNDVDFFSFQANPGTAYFDIDNNPFTFDTVLSLFNSAGTFIGIGDDSAPVDPGSQSARDAFLGVFTIPTSGTYYIAVSPISNLPNALGPGVTLTGLTRPDGSITGGFAVGGAVPGDSSFGGSGSQAGLAYILNISLQAPGGATAVPEPGSLALAGLSLALLALVRRRRHRL